MKRQLVQLFLIAFSAIILVSCGEDNKVKAPEITEFDKYQDPVTQMELTYPKGWVKASEAGSRFITYSSSEARTEFLNMGRVLNEEDIPGAKIDFVTIKKQDTVTMEAFIENQKVYSPETYKTPENVTIDGLPAVKLSYSFPYKVSNLAGDMYIVTKDSQLVTVITTEVIGDQYETLKPKFQEILKSVKVGVKPDNTKKTILKEADPPSTTFKNVSGNGFSISIPDNFTLSGSGAKYSISGDRRADCAISITSEDSKKNSLDDILKQNEKLGKASKTTLGGKPAGLINIAKKDLDSKLYFVVIGDKLYKVFATYYKPEAASYRPAFTKMLGSLKFN